MKKIAVVLFNLGGPDAQAAVQPFLFNLFNDKAIFNVRQPVRWLLAKIVSIRRADAAKRNYALLGGGSPILKHTLEQASALEQHLNTDEKQYKVFICMRYWHPLTEEVVLKVQQEKFDELILLPLYPQFSTTTSASSLDLWKKTANRIGLKLPTKVICCYPAHLDFIYAHANSVRAEYNKYIEKHDRIRVLFSAHGLPQKVIDSGDPYQIHVEATVAAVMQYLADLEAEYVICYQSKVGPLQWLEPSIESEIKRAAADNIAVLIVPIAFVSEHVETLVELDIEYKELAEKLKLPGYYRVPALGCNPDFINALKQLCVQPHNGTEQCCLNKKKCYLRSQGKSYTNAVKR